MLMHAKNEGSFRGVLILGELCDCAITTRYVGACVCDALRPMPSKLDVASDIQYVATLTGFSANAGSDAE